MLSQEQIVRLFFFQLGNIVPKQAFVNGLMSFVGKVVWQEYAMHHGPVIARKLRKLGVKDRGAFRDFCSVGSCNGRRCFFAFLNNNTLDDRLGARNSLAILVIICKLKFYR